MPTLVLLELRAKKESVDTLKQTLKGLLPDTRKYAGCRGITFHTSQDDPQTFVALEEWETRGAYEKYLAWRTETGVLAKLVAMTEGPPKIRYFDPLDA